MKILKALRFLNPFYAALTERQLTETLALSRQLAAHSIQLATDANELVDKDAQAFIEGTRTLTEIEAGLETMRGTLITITNELSSGRPDQARVLVDALIFLLSQKKDAA